MGLGRVWLRNGFWCILGWSMLPVTALLQQNLDNQVWIVTRVVPVTQWYSILRKEVAVLFWPGQGSQSMAYRPISPHFLNTTWYAHINMPSKSDRQKHSSLHNSKLKYQKKIIECQRHLTKQAHCDRCSPLKWQSSDVNKVQLSISSTTSVVTLLLTVPAMWWKWQKGDSEVTLTEIPLFLGTHLTQCNRGQAAVAIPKPAQSVQFFRQFSNKSSKFKFFYASRASKIVVRSQFSHSDTNRCVISIRESGY